MMNTMKKQVSIFILIFIGLLAGCQESHQDTQTPPSQQNSAVPEVTSTLPDSAEFVELRNELVDSTIAARGIDNEDVLEAMRAVPRHLFVPEDLRHRAYADHPLPIGYGQTISQPYIVAWMTEQLALTPGDKVLEIGTGSGYQAAVLAELGYVEVYSIEIIPELAERAARDLAAAGYNNVNLQQGDGYFGWEEHAPFDAIIVTAAPDHLPLPLVDQIKDTGRIVIPIGPTGGYQSLWRFEIVEGELIAYNLGGVRFVPFTREGE
jgi:protein-L-isoaspartate(D-aspartate) O-methyltransferase